MTMRPGRDNRLGNVLCSCTHARRLVGAPCGAVDLPVCRSLIHAVNFVVVVVVVIYFKRIVQ